MAAAGKSLVGFMDREAGIKYLRDACAFDVQDTSYLARQWETAQRKIGRPRSRYGQPELRDIPEEHLQYIDTLRSTRWLRPRLEGDLAGAEFKIVEVDPLLAMQFAVSTDRSDHHCQRLPRPPTLADLLPICLPHTAPTEEVGFDKSPEKTSILIKTKNLSMRIVHPVGEKIITTEEGVNELHVGVQLEFPLPLVHVVRFNGRCYLHNGFHRAYGARVAGATHIPCLYREVHTEVDVGISHLETFTLAQLQSDNPPTVGHFADGRAHDVPLKTLTKVIQVSWGEFTVDGL